MNIENILPKTDKRHLRYDFTAVEVHDLSVEMANKTLEIRSVEEEKKSVTSSYASRLNILKESVNSLANKVASGYEIREFEFDLEFHKPTQGFKTLTPKDDKAKPIIEKMTNQDYNLWNQYHEEKEALPV
jgi:pyruvate/2-oxoacid:ferredoxin oxidoreductase beta subunit